jgi:hypothetical protein
MVVIFSFSINIAAITAEAAIETHPINMNVGEKKALITYKINGGWYTPSGKYTISDTSVVGMECKYDKKRDEWSNYFVALRPGSATITQWFNNKKLIKFTITVKRTELDSITSFFGGVKSYIKSYGPEETDEAAQEILKKLNIDQYNSDRERIVAISKYLYKNVTYDNSIYDYVLANAYGALINKRAGIGINKASDLLLQNLGYDLTLTDYLVAMEHQWSEIKLDGIYYIYDLVRVIITDMLIGSETYDITYSGEGTYSNEAGEILQGSLYVDETGIVDNWLADTYTNDMYNEILSTHGYLDQTQEEKLYYLSTKRKSHLPAWLIGVETPQQMILEKELKVLPDDRLSSNVFSSDESIVKIKDNKLVGVREGIAIVYRYDDTYCDAFYVVVDNKVSSKSSTVNFRTDGKKQSTYKSSDFCAYRSVINVDDYVFRRDEVWKNTVVYKLESVLNGGKLETAYKDGYLSANIIDSNGNKQILFNDNDYNECE